MILTPTKFNTKEVRFAEWGVDFTPGPLHLFLLVILIIYMGAGFYNLLKKYKKSKKTQKAQIKYLFGGTLIILILGTLINLILPLFFDYGRLSSFGPSTSLIFIGCVAYAIIKKGLFEIKVILTEILVGVMGVILLILAFLMETFRLRMLTIGILLLYCIIGYFLIRATYKEIRQKEKIEKLSKKLIEEEKKLTEVHREIAEEKQRRLERIYSASVEKELEIIKLKEKIRELEEKLEKEKREKT